MAWCFGLQNFRVFENLIMKIFQLALLSVIRYISLIYRKFLHLKKDRLGQLYRIDDRGTYAIFRETISQLKVNVPEVVLIVGFRLKLIKSNPFCHWLFQRVCILTTPFWSGFKGFQVKLWMVDPKTKNYLGIYNWEGEKNALAYAKALVTVLKPLSVKDSVWFKINQTQSFERYFRSHQVS